MRASTYEHGQDLRHWPRTNSSGTTDLAEVAGAIEQLKRAHGSATLRVDGLRVGLSNLDREVWPAVPGRRALSKRDLLIYLCAASAPILSHLRDRPLTLARYPDGIRGGKFPQKHFGQTLPRYVQTVRAYSEHEASIQDRVLCNSLPTLLWLGQTAELELNSSLGRIAPAIDSADVFAESTADATGSLLDYPDFMLFDLEPCVCAGQELPNAEPSLYHEGFARCRQVALWLKEDLDSLSLTSFVKTSGAMGLQVYVPILRQFPYEDVRSLAKIIAHFLVGEHPNEVTAEWPVVSRTGRVFLDYKQNTRAHSPLAPYSPRALPYATVATPLDWEELADVDPTDFTILSVPDRLSRRGDPWSRILEAKQDLLAIG